MEMENVKHRISVLQKLLKFIHSYTILSAFLLGIFFTSVLGIITFSLIEIPQNGLPPGVVTLIPFTFLQMALTTTVIFLMRKLDIFRTSDYGIKFLGKGLILAWVGIAGIFGSFFLNFFKFPENYFIFPNIFYFFVVFFHPLIGTALYEETLCRGLILKILLKKAGHTKNGIILSCVVSSVVFGVIHISNYPLVGISVIAQVLAAIGNGLFYAALYLRTRTLLVPILIHGFTNISHQIFHAIISPDVFIQIAESKSQGQMEFVTLENIFFMLLSTLPYLIVGFILLRKVTPEKLQIDNGVIE